MVERVLERSLGVSEVAAREPESLRGEELDLSPLHRTGRFKGRRLPTRNF